MTRGADGTKLIDESPRSAMDTHQHFVEIAALFYERRSPVAYALPYAYSLILPTHKGQAAHALPLADPKLRAERVPVTGQLEGSSSHVSHGTELYLDRHGGASGAVGRPVRHTGRDLFIHGERVFLWPQVLMAMASVVGDLVRDHAG